MTKIYIFKRGKLVSEYHSTPIVHFFLDFIKPDMKYFLIMKQEIRERYAIIEDIYDIETHDFKIVV